MQSVGEVMAIGRNFAESLQKAIRSLEQGRLGFALGDTSEFVKLDDETLWRRCEVATPERLFAAARGHGARRESGRGVSSAQESIVGSCTNSPRSSSERRSSPRGVDLAELRPPRVAVATSSGDSPTPRSRTSRVSAVERRDDAATPRGRRVDGL